MRQRREEVKDWLDQLSNEEKVLLRDTREARNASEIKEILLDLLRSDPEIRNELVVSITLLSTFLASRYRTHTRHRSAVKLSQLIAMHKTQKHTDLRMWCYLG